MRLEARAKGLLSRPRGKVLYVSASPLRLLVACVRFCYRTGENSSGQPLVKVDRQRQKKEILTFSSPNQNAAADGTIGEYTSPATFPPFYPIVTNDGLPLANRQFLVASSVPSASREERYTTHYIDCTCVVLMLPRDDEDRPSCCSSL